nr:reverse transcriptase domain-containing protein [Tanacetum cinerariifolium]
MKQLAAAALYSVEEVLQNNKSDAWRAVAKDIELSAVKEAVKAMQTYKQSYNAKHKSALENQLKITTGLTKEKTSEFKTKKPEESSLNWNPSHTPIGCTPYNLVYIKYCHFPIELEHQAYWALKHVNFDFKTAGGHRKVQLNELNKLRDQAYENSLIYKEKTKKIHDSKTKNRIFNVGDHVLLFNSRLKIFSGKLKTRWSGPFTITKVFPYGTIELSQPDGPNFKVNGHRVKHYFGGDVPQLAVPDLQTFPWTNECGDRVKLM